MTNAIDDIWRYVIMTRGDQPRLTCSAIGAAYGTAKAGIGIAGVGTFRPDLIMKVIKGLC